MIVTATENMAVVVVVVAAATVTTAVPVTVVVAEVVPATEMMMAVVVVVVGRTTVWPWWWRWPRSQLISQALSPPHQLQPPVAHNQPSRRGRSMSSCGEGAPCSGAPDTHRLNYYTADQNCSSGNALKCV